MVKKAKKLAMNKKRFGIVVSRFNEFVTKRLLSGCLGEFRRQGIAQEQLTIVWVPGAFEIPLVAQRLAQNRQIDAVVALGAVIRGETIHFDLVAQAAKEGILQVGLNTGKPVIFGVITTETVDQAFARSEAQGANKGKDAAQAAIEMLEVLGKI